MKKKKLIIIGTSVLALVAMSAIFFNASRLSLYTRHEKLNSIYGSFPSMPEVATTKYKITVNSSSKKTRCSINVNGRTTNNYAGKSNKHTYEVFANKPRNKVIVRCTKGKGRGFSNSKNMTTRTLYLVGPNEIKSIDSIYIGKADHNIRAQFKNWEEAEIKINFENSALLRNDFSKKCKIAASGKGKYVVGQLISGSSNHEAAIITMRYVFPVSGSLVGYKIYLDCKLKGSSSSSGDLHIKHSFNVKQKYNNSTTSN